MSTSKPPTNIIAVAIDTNVVARGQLNLANLRSFASRLSRHSIELWVPTQVIWEWAVHAAETTQKYIEASKLTRKLSGTGLDVAGLAARPAWAKNTIGETADGLVGIFTSSVSSIDNVVVVPPDPDAAIAAIRDQILGTGPGRKKQTTRTGASDSALVRDISAQRNRTAAGGHIIFCSRDRDIPNALSDLDWPSSDYTVVKSEADVYELIGNGTAPTPGTAAYLTAHLATHTRERLSLLWRSPEIDLSSVVSTDEFDRLNGTLETVTSVEVEDARLIGITDLVIDVNEGDQIGYATFTVNILADVLIDGYYIDQNGELEMEQVLLSELVIDLPCAAELAAPIFEPTRVHQTDVASAEHASSRTHWTAPEAAFNWLIKHLHRLEGVTVEVDESVSGEALIVLVNGPNHAVEMDLIVNAIEPSGGIPGGWVMQAGQFSLRCAYEPRSDRYRLTTIVGSRSYDEPYTGIGEIWRTIS